MILFAGNQEACSKATYSRKLDLVVDPCGSLDDLPRKDILAGDRLLNERFAEEEINTWRERCRKCPDDWEQLWTILQYARSYRVTRGLWRDPPTSVSNSQLFEVVTYQASRLKPGSLKLQTLHP